MGAFYTMFLAAVYQCAQKSVTLPSFYFSARDTTKTKQIKLGQSVAADVWYDAVVKMKDNSQMSKS